MDQEAIIITANIFGPVAYRETRMFAIAKARLYNGLEATFRLFTGLVGTLAPRIVLDQNGMTYLLAAPSAGWLGFAWNWPRDTQHWHAIGYPAASPFDGRRQQVCAASDAIADTNFSPATIGIGCDQTGGTSGGPWIMNFSGFAGASNYLNGNQSYKYTSPAQPLAIYGPYFDSSSKSLRDTIVGDEP